jgi:hypothetical protein
LRRSSAPTELKCPKPSERALQAALLDAHTRAKCARPCLPTSRRVASTELHPRARPTNWVCPREATSLETRRRSCSQPAVALRGSRRIRGAAGRSRRAYATGSTASVRSTIPVGAGWSTLVLPVGAAPLAGITRPTILTASVRTTQRSKGSGANGKCNGDYSQTPVFHRCHRSVRMIGFFRGHVANGDFSRKGSHPITRKRVIDHVDLESEGSGLFAQSKFRTGDDQRPGDFAGTSFLAWIIHDESSRG